MKFKIPVVCLLFLVGSSGIDLAAADKIQWHTYESGMARSRFEKKRVFLHFYADWCSYCKEMERKTFQDPTVIATLNRDFVPIRVDTDRDTATSSLFRVKGLPDSWFLTESGEIVGHRPGYISAEQLMGILRIVTSGAAGK
jgi:thiol:disulfide interchange protein